MAQIAWLGVGKGLPCQGFKPSMPRPLKRQPKKLQHTPRTHPGQSLEHANYERNPFQKPVGKSCLGCVPVRCHWFTTLNPCFRCQFESGSGSCWAPLCPRRCSSAVSSAEIAVGQYVVSQRQYLECLIASPSLEFVDKKMQTSHKRMVI